MKLVKKHKKSSSKEYSSEKDFQQLNEHEKKSHNKPRNTGNFIEKKWFPNERK